MLPIRVYYEDTDCGGVVYYANYLKYFERGRTEFLRDRGVSLAECHDKGIVFVVTRAELDYLSPGKYNDLLLLDTQLANMSRITMTFRHIMRKEGSEKQLVTGLVTLATVNRDGKPVRLPGDIEKTLRTGLNG